VTRPHRRLPAASTRSFTLGCASASALAQPSTSISGYSHALGSTPDSDDLLCGLALGHVEGGRKLDIAHMVAAQIDMHQAGHLLILRRVAIELDARASDEAQSPTPMIATRTFLLMCGAFLCMKHGRA
jgi:hypothetical protein